jgi:pimeloyl-ACP methyl ester carboxylesterase
MAYSTSNGVRVYYETVGEGPDLVFAHANPLDHRMRLYQTACLSRRFRVTVNDLRAYGRSDKPVHRYPFGDVTADVRAICDRTVQGRAILGGASMGAKLALDLALAEPDRFAALVLVGGNAFRGASYDSRIEGYRSRLESYRAEHLADLVAPSFRDSGLGRHLMAWLTEDTAALSGEAIARLFEAFDGVDLGGQVASLRLPVLIVNGEHDLSLAGARRTAALIPGAVHRIIPDAGHLCCLEAPAAFDAIVKEFLAANGLWPPIA